MNIIGEVLFWGGIGFVFGLCITVAIGWYDNQ